MNWLSHIYLSRDDIHHRLGNLLADTLKGGIWDGADPGFIEGVAMHRAIDTFTDGHPVVSRSKARLGEKGHLKGVVIDVLYDHFLSRNWADYEAVPRRDFIARFHAKALAAAAFYPARQRNFIAMLTASNRLSSYVHFDGFVATLKRMDSRLSERIRRRETAESYVPAVEAEYSRLEEDFRVFFPELTAFVHAHAMGGAGSI